MGSELCKTCAHTKVCMYDKNIVGDVFVAGNPMFFDNSELYRKFKEREAAGFPCADYLPADAAEVKTERPGRPRIRTPEDRRPPMQTREE